jgi:hypothetical protein
MELTLRALHHLGGQAPTSDIDEAVFHAASPRLRPREFAALSRRLRTVRNELLDREWLAHPSRGVWELTDRGAEEVTSAATVPPTGDSVPEETTDEGGENQDGAPTTNVDGARGEQDGQRTRSTPRHLVQGSTIAEPLLDPGEREQLDLPTSEDEPMTMLIELNLRHGDGLGGAKAQFLEIYKRVPGTDPDQVVTIADIYLRCWLSLDQAKSLVREDIKWAETDKAPGSRSRHRAIYRIWPDFPVQPI